MCVTGVLKPSENADVCSAGQGYNLQENVCATVAGGCHRDSDAPAIKESKQTNKRTFLSPAPQQLASSGWLVLKCHACAGLDRERFKQPVNAFYLGRSCIS